MSGLRKNRRVKRENFSDTRKSRNVLVISFLSLWWSAISATESRNPEFHNEMVTLLTSSEVLYSLISNFHLIREYVTSKIWYIWQLEVKWDLYEGSLKAKDHWWLFQHFLCWYGLIMCRFFSKSQCKESSKKYFLPYCDMHPSEKEFWQGLSSIHQLLIGWREVNMSLHSVMRIQFFQENRSKQHCRVFIQSDTLSNQSVPPSNKKQIIVNGS